MKYRSSSKSFLLIFCGAVILGFLVFPMFQPKIIGRETNSPCSGISGFGFRKVKYVTETAPTNWEGLAHYETWCLFGIDLKLDSKRQPQVNKEQELQTIDSQDVQPSPVEMEETTSSGWTEAKQILFTSPVYKSWIRDIKRNRPQNVEAVALMCKTTNGEYLFDAREHTGTLAAEHTVYVVNIKTKTVIDDWKQGGSCFQ